MNPVIAEAVQRQIHFNKITIATILVVFFLEIIMFFTEVIILHQAIGLPAPTLTSIVAVLLS